MAERSAKDVFAEIVELAPSERAEALPRLCDGDEALHREVRELLALHDSAPRFLGDPTFASSGPTRGATRAEDVGTVIAGKYKLLELVGEGGFGQVFMAEQREPIRRMVALKILPPELSLDRNYLQRFLQEARNAAALEHPHIVPIYAIGEAQGFHYAKPMPADAFAQWFENNSKQ